MTFGQLKYGTYKMSSKSVDRRLGENFSELLINQDNTFKYKYLTTLSCLLWYDVTGRWDINNGNLVLTDSVYSYHPVVDFIQNKPTNDYQISISVTTKDRRPIQGVKISYLFKNSRDTLSGQTNSHGEFSIETRKRPRSKTSTSIDDVEIWVVYFDNKNQDWTTNTFSSLSAEIKCIIDKDAVDELVLRTTTYKIQNEDLIYESQIFSKADSQPDQHLFGNFRFEK
jgi:hypothetical protein